jgi:predicted N-acetyltransferase YhbS
MSVVPARAGDHTAVFFFLASVLQQPSRAEFKASMEDPFYEPHDRLLIRRGHGIVGHVCLTHRAMQFGRMQFPVAGLDLLVVAPEHRGEGLGARLLGSAEREMIRSGALLGWLRTTVPHFFRRTGWAVCGRHCHSRASVCNVLSKLLDRDHGQAPLLRRPRRRLQIRPWRRWEEAALVRIYNQNLSGTYGALERTEAYWRWLVCRQAYDQIYVALDGPDLLELEEINTQIVGYAVRKGETILEMLTAPGRRGASAELLGHVCGEAIEHDRHAVLVQAPPTSPWHKLFQRAGGRQHHHEADRGQVYMVRVLNPLKVLRRLCPEFYYRAERADLPRPLELGLLAEGKKYLLEVTRHGARAVSRRLGRDYLCLNEADFTRALLGQLDWPRAVADRRVEASSAAALETVRVLLPRLPLWYPPWDTLPA